MATRVRIRETGEAQFAVCPECGYEGGFHIVLVPEADKADPVTAVLLKCPSCAHEYDVGMTVRLAP